MVTRVVMVEFNPDAPPEAFAAYEQAQAALARRLPCVQRMLRGENFVPQTEANLRAGMPRVTFPAVLSIWEFEDEAGLDAFLSAPEHIRMSKSNFIQHVAHRWVGNLRSGGPDRGHEE